MRTSCTRRAKVIGRPVVECGGSGPFELGHFHALVNGRPCTHRHRTVCAAKDAHRLYTNEPPERDPPDGDRPYGGPEEDVCGICGETWMFTDENADHPICLGCGSLRESGE